MLRQRTQSPNSEDGSSPRRVRERALRLGGRYDQSGLRSITPRHQPGLPSSTPWCANRRIIEGLHGGLLEHRVARVVSSSSSTSDGRTILRANAGRFARPVTGESVASPGRAKSRSSNLGTHTRAERSSQVQLDPEIRLPYTISTRLAWSRGARSPLRLSCVRPQDGATSSGGRRLAGEYRPEPAPLNMAGMQVWRLTTLRRHALSTDEPRDYSLTYTAWSSRERRRVARLAGIRSYTLSRAYWAAAFERDSRRPAVRPWVPTPAVVAPGSHSAGSKRSHNAAAACPRSPHLVRLMTSSRARTGFVVAATSALSAASLGRALINPNETRRRS